MEKKKIFAGVLLFLACAIIFGIIFIGTKEKRAQKLYSQGVGFSKMNDPYNAYYNFSKISMFSKMHNIALLRQAMCALEINDQKTAYSKLKNLSYFSKDDYITPYALYNAALINIEHKKYASANKKLRKIYEKYPNSDFKKAAAYQLGKIYLKKDPKYSLSMFLEYLKYAPTGKFSPDSISAIERLNLPLDYEQKGIIVKSLVEQNKFNKAEFYTKKCKNFELCYYNGLILEKTNRFQAAKASYLMALVYSKDTDDPKLMQSAIKKYQVLSGAEFRENYSYLLSKTLQKGAHAAVLFEYAKKLSKIAEIKNYETIYTKYPASYWAAESLWRAFYYYYKNNSLSAAKSLATMHIQKYSSSNSTPAIKYFYAKILFKEGHKKNAKALLLDVIKNEPNSYWALVSSEFLAGNRTPFDTSKNAYLIDSDTAFSKAELKNLFKSSKTLYTLSEYGDFSALEALRPQDEFIKSYIEKNKGNRAYSILLAKNALLNMVQKPSFSDPRMKLAYPIYYSSEINKYSDKYGENPYLMLALIKEESTFNKEIKSSVGATGLMQLMPNTASELSLGAISADELRNPDLNINLGIKYFSKLTAAFDGNEMLAVLSYNGGPNAVLKWTQTLYNKDFDNFIEDIPYSETQNYIKKVFASYWNYINIYR